MSKIFFIAPRVDSDITLETAWLDPLAEAAETLGLDPVLVVGQNLKRRSTAAGRPVWGVLDSSPQSERQRTLVNARLLALHRFDVLADRLAFVCDSRRPGPQDTLCLLDASVPDLESVWQFLMTTPPETLPHVHVHLSRLYDPDLVLEAAGLNDLADRIALLRARFEARGLLQAGRLTLSAGHPALARRLSDLGLETASAPLQGSGRPGGRSTALLVKSFEPDLAETLDLYNATVFLSDALVPAAQADLAADGMDAERAISFAPLSDATRQLARFGSVITETDLLDLVLSCPGPVGGAVLRLIGTADPVTPSAPMNGADFIAMLRDLQAKAGTPEPKPVVLHVANNWWGQGSSHVFEAQLRYLAERGYAVLAVHFDIDDSGFFFPEGVADTLTKLPQDGALHRWRLGRDPALSAQEKGLGLNPPYRADMLSVEGESRIARNVAVPPALRAALKALRPAWALVNYSQNHPLIAALDLEEVPVITETHDLRTVQHAIYGETTLDQIDYDLELDNAGHFDGLVFINAHEEKLTRDRLPDLKGISAFPFMLGNAAIEPRPLHETAVTPVLRALSRSRRPCLSLAARLAGQDGSSDAGPKRPVILFVGSRHKANVTSLDWYFANVHLPFRIFEQADLVVAGNIADDYPDSAIPGVTFLGRVDDLLALYDSADIVLLPIREGTGLPIKVIDTLMAQKPFVCTSNAIRAITEMDGRWPTFDDPAGFAGELLKLAGDPAYLAAAEARLKEISDPEESWRDYAARWDRLVTEVVGQAPPQDDDHVTPVLMPQVPQALPLPRTRLVAGQRLSVRHGGLLWEHEGLATDDDSEQFHFGQPLGRLALHFALARDATASAGGRARSLRLDGVINSDQNPDTVLNFFVNGQPAGRMSTNRQYQKPFCLFAEPICRDGAALVVIEVFLTNQDGVPIVPATTKRWVALDQLTLTPAAR